MKFLFVLFFFLAPMAIHADTSYTTLAPIQNFVADKEEISQDSFSEYLNNMFKLGIALCTGLAVLMLIIGGIQYVSSDAWSKKTDGRERMFAALFGLLIALGSYALLQTLSPDLLSTELTMKPVKLVDIKVTPVDVVVGSDGLITNGNVSSQFDPASSALSKCNEPVTDTQGGLTRTQSGTALDSDGSSTSAGDSTSTYKTSYTKGDGNFLNAQTDNYVAVPHDLAINGQAIKNGTRVLITNTVDGKSAWGIVGDRNSVPNGKTYRGEAGEMSVAALKAVGLYEGVNSTKYSNQKGAVTFTYFPNAPKAGEIGC